MTKNLLFFFSFLFFSPVQADFGGKREVNQIPEVQIHREHYSCYILPFSGGGGGGGGNFAINMAES